MSVAVMNLRFVKPLDLKTLTDYVKRSKSIFVVEEGNGIGGVFSHILTSLEVDKSGSLSNCDTR